MIWEITYRLDSTADQDTVEEFAAEMLDEFKLHMDPRFSESVELKGVRQGAPDSSDGWPESS